MLLAAVTNAFADSLNALLIGVIVALGVMLPRGSYKKVVPLLIVGDWLGVFTLAVACMAIFDGLDEQVKRLTESTVFGWALIAVGVLIGVLTLMSKPGGDNKLVARILDPLRAPGPKTVLVGFILGFVQSVTSAPFFAGLLFLAAGGYGPLINYGGMVIYASIALSLPTLSALLVGWVRSYPDSPAGRAFTAARDKADELSKVSGFVVAGILIALGVVYL